MKLPRKPPPPSPRIGKAVPAKPPKGNSSSTTSPPASLPQSPPVQPLGDGYTGYTGADRTPSRRPSTPSNTTKQVQGPDASGAKKPTSNEDIRKWYLDKVNTIPELDTKWAVEGVPLPERARRAVEIRHNARLEARNMMKDPQEVEMLRARDLAKYGNPDGPTFDQLVEKAQANGHQGDEVWKELLGSSNRTDQTVNQHLLGTPPQSKP